MNPSKEYTDDEMERRITNENEQEKINARDGRHDGGNDGLRQPGNRPCRDADAGFGSSLPDEKASIGNLDNDTRVFAVDKSIEVKNVRFQNRYGFEVAGHLYLPEDFDISR